MRITKIKIKNFGRIEYFEAEINSNIVFICENKRRFSYGEFLTAIGLATHDYYLLFLNRYLCVFQTDSEIELECYAGEKKIVITCIHDDSREWKFYRKIQINGIDISSDDEASRTLVRNYIPTHADYNCIYEDGIKKSFIFGIKSIREDLIADIIYHEDKSYNNAIEKLEAIDNYIKHFKPIIINSRKNMNLYIDREGIFRITDDNVLYLSEHEQNIFYFLTFLTVNNAQEIIDLLNRKAFQSPLFIESFFHYLDYYYDIDFLVKQAQETGRQIFFFVCKNDVKMLKNIKTDNQIVYLKETKRYKNDEPLSF